jgi:flagellin-like hook-associated protein FlgL
LKIGFETNKMKIEDADVIDAMSSLTQKEFAYQAALSATSKVMGLSILDYL